MPKKGLGRGLESLIPKKQTKTTNSTDSGNGIIELEVVKIIPNPHQPREEIEKNSLNELADSIKEHGVIQPLVVTKNKNGKYEVLAGERRLRASKIAGLKKVPVVIRTASEQQKLEVAIVENVQRQDLNPIEEARSYQRLMSEFNLNQDQIALKIGKSRSSVANILRVLSLPEEIQAALRAGKISMGHAKIIMGLRDENEQMKLYKQILSGKLTVKDTEKKSSKVKVYGGKVKIKTPRIVSFEESLRQALGTKVEINNKGKRGKIVIDYYSDSELRDIVEKIS